MKIYIDNQQPIVWLGKQIEGKRICESLIRDFVFGKSAWSYDDYNLRQLIYQHMPETKLLWN